MEPMKIRAVQELIAKPGALAWLVCGTMHFLEEASSCTVYPGLNREQAWALGLAESHKRWY